jgi:hypothetical protein
VADIKARLVYGSGQVRDLTIDRRFQGLTYVDDQTIGGNRAIFLWNRTDATGTEIFEEQATSAMIDKISKDRDNRDRR